MRACPTWVIISAALAIGGGTYVGGWRVIRTMGTRITEIEPPQGFAADASSAAVILASTHYGFPLSTTHVCAGSIIGSGVGKKLADVRWGVAGRLAIAWVITLPAAALVGGGTSWVCGAYWGNRRRARDGGRRAVLACGAVPRDAPGSGHAGQRHRARRDDLQRSRADQA